LNAFQPPVSVLIKLAEIVGAHYPFDHISSDPEVLEWYDRMAELKYVPARPKPKFEAVVKNVEEGELVPLKLLDGPEELVECGAVISMQPARRGWQVFATGPEGPVASYIEAVTTADAMHACHSQFPFAEGYHTHGVKDIESQAIAAVDEEEALEL